jgi:hypothetical protein
MLLGCWDGGEVAEGLAVTLGVSVGNEDGVVCGDEDVNGVSVGIGEFEGEVDVSGVSEGLILGDSLGSGVRVGCGDEEGDGDSVGLSVGVGVGDAGGVPAPFISAAWETAYLVEFSGAVMF